MDEKEKIKADLKDLCQEAREKKLWLRCFYQDLWFSPTELEAENEKDKFIWGRVNWVLRNPMEALQALEERMLILRATREKLKKRIRESRND